MLSFMKLEFILNGKPVEAQVKEGLTLLQLLREVFKLTGTKEGCGKGECGACTVIVDGDPVTSCLYAAGKINGKKVETIEGIGTPDALHPIQQAFIDEGAIQCGFCTPGMIMSAKALYDKLEEPSNEDINEAISGNLCRCTGYIKIRKAIQTASKK